MNGRMLLRLGAIVFVAVAITATLVELTRKEDAPVSLPFPAPKPATDSLRERQRRCVQLGQKAAEDEECLRVWAETRDRFLGRTSAPVAQSSREGR